jgi:hypothetical protein
MDPTIDMVHAKSATTSSIEVNNTLDTGYVDAATGGDHGSHMQIF